VAAVHGATVSQEARDADGYWLNKLRMWLGAEKPICATLDLHANLSDAMVAATDLLVAYRSNPHVDQFHRGVETAGYMVDILSNRIRPTQAAVRPPMAINIECQQTDRDPCRRWCDAADSVRRRPEVVTASTLLGFPYADVAPMSAYEPICRHVVRVNTPGVTCADMRQLDYRFRRRPMYPFEEDARFE